MKKILIIGGGLSGLSTALNLIDKDYSIEIIESSPKLGGRTYSFLNSETETIIDNGQHIMMGCYSHTLDFIEKINSQNSFIFQNSLSINYVTGDNNIYRLHSPEKFYPFNLLYSFFNFRLLSLKERKEVLKFLFRLKSIGKRIKNDHTVLQILRNEGQSNSTIKKFWEMVVISAMNIPIKVASAELFIEMIKIIFFSSEKSSNIILPKTDLSNALINPAERYILNKNGKIAKGERVLEIIWEKSKVVKVITSKRIIEDFDYLISTVPADKLVRFLPFHLTQKLNIPELNYSPIVSVNFWLKENPLKEQFYGIIDGKFHWLFNKGTYISLLKSAADEMIILKKNELIETANSELIKYFPILNNIEIISFKVIKERKATFISDTASVKKRKNLINNLGNLFIAGDWINTGLPSTIESSIKSGKMISEMIISST
ncbi:MAG: hydroxysqualene dehydroxylase HpnE [Bacteroidota bacterium]